MKTANPSSPGSERSQRLFRILAAAILLSGCATDGAPPRHNEAAASPGPKTRAEPETIAIVGGKAAGWGELRGAMIEAAGGDVLGEYVLDRQITAELGSRGLSVSDKDVDAEKSIMLSQLSTDKDQAARLLEQLRERMRLGPHRFDAFLRRYAGLRKLVAEQVKVTDAMVRQAYEDRAAEQSVCRMILAESLRDAAAVRKRLDAGESFIDLAIALSKDSSRNQGGLLPPIAPHDPTYPTAITGTASKLAVGEVSAPIALDGGFAILKCERKLRPESVPFDKAQEELRREVRLNLERSMMQRQARLLLERADVTVLNADLDREFKKRKSQAGQGQ